MHSVRLVPPKTTASLSLALTLVALVSLIGPATSQGAFPGANGKIAFHSSRDGNGREIYVMNADGTNQTRLTNNAADDSDPVWSPDGAKIAFWSTRNGNFDIYAMNADGTGETRLTTNTASDLYPAWSPDGTKVAFLTGRDGTGEIYTMNADGTGETRLTSSGGIDPAWSPDGTKIAFVRLHDATEYEIYAMNADGSNPRRLTNNTEWDRYPAWSPDGTKIAFASSLTSCCEIYTMNADGSGLTRLSYYTDDIFPAWSPDGTKIAFTREYELSSSSEIYTMNADGTNQTPLTNSYGERSPDWQPVAVPGGYPRPKGATPLRVSLVPAYAECTAPNRTHGPPLAFASCSPPTQESSQLTVGTPDANGVSADSTGFARYSVTVGVPGGVDDADVSVKVELTDVRRRDTLADYTGELQAAGVVRITDRLGGPANEAATVTEHEHQLTVPCAATGGAAGATCSASTTFDAVVPGTIKEGKRAVWQPGQVRVSDGGPDGLASTTPNTLFAVQGVFVP